jgi:2',3'-cyclic-nucleotide 2'-phosphodiesterase (5'-nucleotidase family)
MRGDVVMKFKFSIRFSIKFWMLFLALFLTGSASCAAVSAAKRPLLVIFHTNDVHGYAFEERDDNGRLTRVGYDRLMAVVDAEEAEHKLLLDAGDVLHGQSFATARRGELIARIISFVGYDAIAAGNHDFDYGYDRLLSLTNAFRLNFLSANVTRDGKRLLPPYTVKDFGDLKVGIFGLSTPETSTTTSPKNIAGLKFEDPIAAAREIVERLREEKVDLIAAVMHMGSESYCDPASTTIAELVPGIDVIIDGHSHSEIGVRAGGALVMSSGQYLQNLGKVTIDRKADGGYDVSSRIISAAELDGIKPDSALRSAMNELRAELESELNVIVTHVPFALDGDRKNIRSSSTNLGRIVCAAIVSDTGADVAFLNGGSFRDSIPAGDVSKGKILNVFPYGNYVYTVEMSGEDLFAIVDFGLGLPGSGAFPQFYGMEVTASERETTDANGARITALAAKSITVGGKPLVRNAKYKVATNDFLYSGGDGYSVFAKYPYNEFSTLEEILKKYLAESSPAVLEAVDRSAVLRKD